MLQSLTFVVLFRVKVETHPDEVVCITGDDPELGNWQIYGGKKLTLEKRPLSSTALALANAANSKGGIWSARVTFHDRLSVKYRFFVARIWEADEGQRVAITRWETNIKPRIFTFTEGEEQEENAIFGEYGGVRVINQGWLTDQSQINIQLHGYPMKMWNTKYRDRLISVKCTPVDLQFRDEQNADDGKSLQPASYAFTSVVKLAKGQSRARYQEEYGVMLTSDSNISFKIQTLEPEHTGFQLEFFLLEDRSLPKLFAYGFFLPLELHTSTDTRTVPIYNVKHVPMGQITFDYLLIKPLKGLNATLKVSYQNHWKPRPALDIGHRGMGVSYSTKSKIRASIRENTVRSLVEAANHGADFVEFDVHLTKDKQVIIYHDFKVHIVYRKKLHGELELLEVPVKDLKLADLQQMKLFPHAASKDHEEINRDDNDPEDLQPFPLLARCLQTVDIHTGFNIEIKYPQWLMDNNAHEQEHYFDLNEFIDIILLDVFKYHGGRRIVFTSFDCNTCIMLRLKQNLFPVMFLTQGDTKVYDWYRDPRTHSVVMASEFAMAHDLLGVNPMSELLLKNPSLISYVKDNGQVLWTWGEDNNDFNTIKRLKQLGLDAVIYDGIDHFKTTGKQSVFKLEKMEKKVVQRKDKPSILKDTSSDMKVKPSDLKDKQSNLTARTQDDNIRSVLTDKPSYLKDKPSNMKDKPSDLKDKQSNLRAGTLDDNIRSVLTDTSKPSYLKDKPSSPKDKRIVIDLPEMSDSKSDILML